MKILREWCEKGLFGLWEKRDGVTIPNKDASRQKVWPLTDNTTSDRRYDLRGNEPWHITPILVGCCSSTSPCHHSSGIEVQVCRFSIQICVFRFGYSSSSIHIRYLEFSILVRCWGSGRLSYAGTVFRFGYSCLWSLNTNTLKTQTSRLNLNGEPK